MQELERQVRQALAASDIGASSPARGRPGPFLEAVGPQTSDSSPLTFASSQFSPSGWVNSQVGIKYHQWQ